MVNSVDLGPAAVADSPPTGPEGASAPDLVSVTDGLPPLAAGAPVAADPLAATGQLTLETGLLGPLTVPDGAARAAELEELSRRAAVYATRARGDGTRRAYRSGWRHYAA